MDPKLFFVFVYLALMSPGYQVLSYKTKKQFGRSYSKDYAFELFPYEKVHDEPVLLEASPRIMAVANGQCRKDAKINQAITANALCKPRPYVVPLDIPQDYDKVDPSHIEVMRCEQSKCTKHPFKSCLPKTKRMKTITVMATSSSKLTKIKAKLTQCFTVEVEEHTDCSCDCPATTCQLPQTYDKNKCRCKCENQNEAYACRSNSQSFWDQKNCRCVVSAGSAAANHHDEMRSNLDPGPSVYA